MTVSKIKIPSDLKDLGAEMIIENHGDKQKYVLTIPAGTKKNGTKFKAYRSFCWSNGKTKRNDLILRVAFDLGIEIKLPTESDKEEI